MLRPGDICRALECEQGETPLSVLHCSTCGSSARLFYGPGNFSEVFARRKSAAGANTWFTGNGISAVLGKCLPIA